MDREPEEHVFHGEIITPDFPRRSFLRDGYAEQRLRDAIQDVIAEYGGNRLIAQGIALEVVKDETEKRL